jgi:hypothetical protein
MNQPQRIQRERIKGWRMPPNTIHFEAEDSEKGIAAALRERQDLVSVSPSGSLKAVRCAMNRPAPIRELS